MGLLDRARVLDTDINGFFPGNPEEDAKQVVSSFRHTPDHIDFPVELFAAFRRVMGFTRGSLMFPDPSQSEYYPWIVKGLDRTSSRRLRIPFDFPPLEDTNATVLTDIPFDSLTPMLSVREAGLGGTPLIVRLGIGDEPAALVLALDSRWNGSEESGILSAACIINEALGDGIRRSRTILDTENHDYPVDPADWFAGWGNEEAVLVILDTSGAIDALMESISGLELYRARRDVVALIRRITGRMGRMYDMKDGRVLILFPADRLPDRDLYLHQLSTAFASTVLDLSAPPGFPAEFMKWPEEKEAVKEALSGFFTE